MKIGKKFLICFLFLSMTELMAQPVNQDCAHALPLSPLLQPSDSVRAVFGNSLPSSKTTCINTTTRFNDLWYTFRNVDSLFDIGFKSNRPLYLAIYDSCADPVFNHCDSRPSQSYSFWFNNFRPNRTYYLRLFREHTTDTTAHKVTLFYRNQKIPSNDLCANAIPLAVSDTGFNYVTVNFVGAKSDVVGDYAPDVWYSVVPTGNLLSAVALINGKNFMTNFDVDVYDACGGTLLTRDLQWGTPLRVVPGKKYFFRVQNTWDYMPVNNFSLGVISPTAPENDSCAHATVLTPSLEAPVYTQVNLKNMTYSVNACNGDAYDVWYKFTAKSTSTAIYFKNTDQKDASYNVHLDCNSRLLCKTTAPSYLFSTVVGKTYYISVFLPAANMAKDKFASIAVVQNGEYPMSCDAAQEVQPAVDNSCTYTSVDFSKVVKTASTIYAWYKFKPSDSLQVIRVNSSGSELAYTVMEDCIWPVSGVVDGTKQNYTLVYSKYKPNVYYYLRIAYSPTNFNSAAEGPLVSFCINSPKVPNDNCDKAVALTDSCFKKKLLDVSTATKSPNLSCQPRISNDVWFKFSTTANANIRYAFELQSSGSYGLSSTNYVLELSESCTGAAPRCIRRSEFINAAPSYYSTIEYMVDSLKANTHYLLRLIMVDLQYGNNTYPTQLYYRWIKSDPTVAGDFYSNPKLSFNGFSDQQCFMYEPCVTSSFNSPPNSSMAGNTLGFYDNWYRFQATSSKLGFVMDNSFYFELFKDNYSSAPYFRTPLNDFYAFSREDSLAYYQTAVDSGSTYLLRIASPGPYTMYSRFSSAVCVQSIKKSGLGDTCAKPIQLPENMWTNATLTASLTASKPNTCVRFATHNRAWLSFQSGTGNKHMTINGISGTPLYGELYTSCNTLTTCFGPIQGNNINLTLTPNTTYLLKLYANKEMLFSNTVQLQLADGLVSGLEENQLENGLQVYPNPAQSVVYVKGAQNQTATLFDFSGKIIEVAQVKEGQLQVGQLPNGLYFLEICSERKRFTIVR